VAAESLLKPKLEASKKDASVSFQKKTRCLLSKIKRGHGVWEHFITFFNSHQISAFSVVCSSQCCQNLARM